MSFRFITLLCGCLTALCLTATLHAANPFFHEPFDTAASVNKYSAWQITPAWHREPDGSSALKLHVPEHAQNATMTVKLPAEALAGQWIEVSALLRGENVAPAREPWNGAKFMLPVVTPATTHYFGAILKRGTFDWERVSFREMIPADATKADIMLGFQDSFGSLYVKDLKVEVLGTPLQLGPVANMGFADPVAADGQGGWSDQGPDNDASRFQPSRDGIYGGVPFRLADPAQNGGKAVLTMKSSNFPNGLEAAELVPAKPAPAAYLYLLHTVCHAAPGGAGLIEVTGPDGALQTIPVEIGRDVADWWIPQRQPNALPAAIWNNPASGTVGIYTSKFELDPGLSPVESVRFRALGGMPVWIILGATLSETNYEFPDSVTVETAANERWQPLPPASPIVVAGSALDCAALWPVNEVAERVIVNPAGQLALEGSPQTPVRFLTVAEGYHSIFNLFKTKEDIEEYVNLVRRRGYNMVRLHYIDDMLMNKSKTDLAFNPMILDRIDYFIHCLKKNGIYLNIDAMSSRYGYEVGNAWENDGSNRYYGYDIYFKENARDNWREGVKQLLTRVNPYTGTRLVDDPVLALVNGYNEQEFAMMEWKYPKNPHYMLPSWRDFLQRRYESLDAYNAVWEKGAASWDEVPIFTADESRGRDARGTDIARWKSELESRQYQWYVEELRAMGYPGIITNYDMGQSMRYIALRKDFEAVVAHSYHAHPTVTGGPEETIDQTSAIGTSNAMFRGLNSTRLANKPFLITEYGVVFWNKYRYEEAFTAGAYAAFQDHSGLTVHSQTVSTRPDAMMRPFNCSGDPIIHTQEFLTAFLFQRGDVAPAAVNIRLDLDTEAMFRDGTFHDGLHYGQSRLCLLTGVSGAVDPDFPVRPGELALSTSGGSTVMTRPGYTKVVDQPGAPFDVDALVREFKQQGLIPESNRTSAAGEIFENSNNELYLDARRHFMSVDTPRLQGVCAEAGMEPVALGNLTVSNLTTRGNVAAVAVDDQPLSDSARIVLVYATNALNTGMVFAAEDMRVLRDFGKAPILVETGGFAISLANRNADRLKLYALNTDGSRRCELPLRKENGSVAAAIDTAALEGGPSLYFELTAE